MADLTNSLAVRVNAIKESTASVRALVQERGLSALERDIVARSAVERLLQIISDASRGLPDEWKARRPDIRWQTIGELGDMISKDYDRLDLGYLWAMYEADLRPLESALEGMIAVHSRGKPSS